MNGTSFNKGELSESFTHQAGASSWARDNGPTFAEQQEKRIFEYSRKEGGAEEIGYRSRNLAKDDLDPAQQGEKKKDKKDDLYHHIMANQHLEEALEAHSAYIADLLQNLEDNHRKITKALNAIKSDDFDQMHIILQEDYKIDTSGMSDRAVRNKLLEETKQTIDDQGRLTERVLENAQEFEEKIADLDKNDPNYDALFEKYSEKLDEIREQFSKYDVDYEAAFLDARRSGNYEYDLLESTQDKETKTDQENVIDPAHSMQDMFTSNKMEIPSP